MFARKATVLCGALLLTGGAALAQDSLDTVDMETMQSAYECYDFNKMRSKPCASVFKKMEDGAKAEAQAGVAKGTGLEGNYSPPCTYTALTNISALFERAHVDLRFSAFGGKLPTLAEYVEHVRGEIDSGKWPESVAQSQKNLVVYYDQVKACSA